MMPDRKLLMGTVKYWLDHERKDTDDLDQRRRLEDALKIAQDDRRLLKRARRSRRRS
jgi:hypothetical protein